VVKDTLNADKKKISLKIKKQVPKPSIAGNWKESETISTSPQHASWLDACLHCAHDLG
jgi:hypothetical protein